MSVGDGVSGSTCLSQVYPMRCTFLTASCRPTGGFVVFLLFITLNLNPQKHQKSFQQHVAEFDFLGLFMLVTGIICLLLGFNENEIACECLKLSDMLYLVCLRDLLSGNQPSTIALLAVGIVLLVLGAVYEGCTKRSPLFRLVYLE